MENEDVLRCAVTSALDVIRVDEPDLGGQSAQKAVELGWGALESIKYQDVILEFADAYADRFEGRELQPFGGSIFDFVVGNVRNAVLHEVIKKLEEQIESLEFCSTQSAFKTVPARDWQVAIARVKDDISVIRQMVA